MEGASHFSIVVPVYNEGENISEALTQILSTVNGSFEILIVYDFDEDTTVPATNHFIKNHFRRAAQIRLVKNNLGRGVLNAIKTGIQVASGRYIVVTMADLSDPPEVINAMVAKANSGFDVVCASRYMMGGKQIGGPKFKKLLSRIAGISLKVLIGIPTQDITNNFRLYSKKVLDHISIESAGGFEFAMEVTLKAYFEGYRITQVPTVWRDRTFGESKFQFFKWLPNYSRWYMYGLKRKLIGLFTHITAKHV